MILILQAKEITMFNISLNENYPHLLNLNLQKIYYLCLLGKIVRRMYCLGNKTGAQ